MLRKKSLIEELSKHPQVIPWLNKVESDFGNAHLRETRFFAVTAKKICRKV